MYYLAELCTNSGRLPRLPPSLQLCAKTHAHILDWRKQPPPVDIAVGKMSVDPLASLPPTAPGGGEFGAPVTSRTDTVDESHIGGPSRLKLKIQPAPPQYPYADTFFEMEVSAVTQTKCLHRRVARTAWFSGLDQGYDAARVARRCASVGVGLERRNRAV